MPEIMIVGAGAVGTALAFALKEKHYPVTIIVSRQLGSAQLLAEKIGAPFAYPLSDYPPTIPDLVFLCVPDDAIEPVANKLANPLDWTHKVVAHTSGAHTSSVLHSLKSKGAFVMSFHPVQTFTLAEKSSFSGIFIGIEGEEPAVTLGKSIAIDLESKPWVLSADQKPRYHLAASMASNFLVTLVGNAADVLESIGMERKDAIDFLRPLVTQTCTNVTTQTPEQALTGPAVRGDLNTLQTHLSALTNHVPELTPLYTTLLTNTLNLALKSGRLSSTKYDEILRALNLPGPLDT